MKNELFSIAAVLPALKLDDMHSDQFSTVAGLPAVKSDATCSELEILAILPSASSAIGNNVYLI